MPSAISTPGILRRGSDESNDIPNPVAIESGINMNSRFTEAAHMLKASTGIRGRSTKTGGLAKDIATGIVILANARVPKYAASILFLEVIAYILGRNRIS